MDSRLTFSQIMTAAKCPWRHNLAYVHGIRPVEDGLALRIGAAFHAGLDTYFKTLQLEDKDERRKHFTDCVHAAVDAFDEHRPNMTFDDYVDRERLAAMMIAYSCRWGIFDDGTVDPAQRLEVLASEEAFNIPLVNPDTDRASRTWTLAGKRDRRIVLPDGRMAVLENKTASDDLSPDSDYWKRLRFDLQISIYVLSALDEGHDIRTVVYDVVRKPQLEPRFLTQAETKLLAETGEYKTKPSTNSEEQVLGSFSDHKLGYAGLRQMIENTDPERLKVSADGTKYSVREDMEMFHSRVLRDMCNRTDYYFARREIPRLQSDLDRARKDLWYFGRIIADCDRFNRWPRNTASCVGFGKCPYFDLCAAGFEPGDPLPEQFVTVENTHAELAAV